MKRLCFFLQNMLLLSSMCIASALYSFQSDPAYAPQPQVQQEVKVAVITLHGEIYDDILKELSDQLEYAFRDSSFAAVVLLITSPGGAAGTSSAVHILIKELRAKYPKPLVVCVSTLCASGGYYIACGADSIIVSSGALLGSIGVIFEMWRFKELLEKLHLQHDIFKAGEYKALINPYEVKTEERDAHLQEVLNDTYSQFVADVESARSAKLKDKDMNIWANGKIFSGKQAVEIGLADAIGAQLTVEQHVRQLSKTPEHIPIRWVHLTKYDSDTARATGTSSLLETLIIKLAKRFRVCREGLLMHYMH